MRLKIRIAYMPLLLSRGSFSVSLVPLIIYHQKLISDKGTIMYLIGRESIYCVKVQQAYLRLPGNATRIASRTVLFTDVPADDVSNEQKLREIFPAAKMFWPARNTEELNDLLEDRDDVVEKLESGLVHMSKAVNERQRKLNKNGERESQADILQHVYDNEYPRHKLKPVIGKQVETLPWAREQLQKLNPQIEELQKHHISGQTTFLPAVFVEFETVEAAEAAFHQPNHGGWIRYRPRAIGKRPQEIVWKNLKMGKAQRTARSLAVIAAICAMTVFWGPITAFIGSLTNINYLTNLIPFLDFIENIPGPILGIVTGLLPVLLLAILMILVPVIMRGESFDL